MQAGKLNIIIDGQWGSTGKGRIAGLLTPKADASVCDFMPQAGHTVIWWGKKYVFRQLPVGCLIPGHRVYIGPGAVIDPELLLHELDWCAEDVKVIIDWRVPVLEHKDAEIEHETCAWMGSTCEGCGSCLSRKLRRLEDVTLIGDCDPVRNHPKVVIDAVYPRLKGELNNLAKVLVETAQGFCLSLNHGDYPHVTSRDVTLTAVLDRIGGFHPSFIGDVHASLRTFPIRVGGPSGPCYSDQVEMEWGNLPCPPAIPERTTVTNRQRRIFSWSQLQFIDFMERTRPTHIHLSFGDYLIPVMDGVTPNINYLNHVRDWIDVNVKRPSLDCVGYVPKLTVSFGPKPEDIVPWS